MVMNLREFWSLGDGLIVDDPALVDVVGNDAPKGGSAPPVGRKKALLWLDPTNAAKVAAAFAGGLTVLTTVLTTFGIKEGALDRMVGKAPHAVLLIFVLVGIGVLVALGSAALNTSQTRRLLVWPLLVAVTMALAMVWVFVPDVPTRGRDVDVGEWLSLRHVVQGLVGLVALLIAVHVLRKRDARTTATAGALALSMATTGLGLYSAVKLAVASKTGDVNLRGTAEVVTADTGSTLKLLVQAGRLADDGGVLLQVDADGSPVASSVVRPDVNGEVSQTQLFPLPSRGFKVLKVFSCPLPSVSSRSAAEVGTTDQASALVTVCSPDTVGKSEPLLTLYSSGGATPSVTGQLEVADTSVKVTVTARGKPDAVVPVQLSCPGRVLMSGTALIDANGRGALSSTVPAAACAATGALVTLTAGDPALPLSTVATLQLVTPPPVKAAT